MGLVIHTVFSIHTACPLSTLELKPFFSGPLESCHKDLRKYREHLARLTGIDDNLGDIAARLYCRSSPILRSLKPKKKLRRRQNKPNSEDDDVVENFFHHRARGARGGLGHQNMN